ncbi:MAG: mftB [Citricoccus sp.]|jgi:mycofactocin biosynthesis protein MftB|nr:mftB [Citricoccus sp. WCRC_4]
MPTPVQAAPVLDVAASPRLARSVSVRPERFGALLYDFRTRKLMFLKSPRLAHVVRLMDGTTTVGDCMDRAEVPAGERGPLLQVLHHLQRIRMLTDHPLPEGGPEERDTP